MKVGMYGGDGVGAALGELSGAALTRGLNRINEKATKAKILTTSRRAILFISFRVDCSLFMATSS